MEDNDPVSPEILAEVAKGVEELVEMGYVQPGAKPDTWSMTPAGRKALERAQRRAARSKAWKLLRAGFVTLSYDPDGQERFTIHPDAVFNEEEQKKVLEALGEAGPQGATCEEIAEKLGFPLVKVRAIVGDIPE
jgi:DNA-binding IclR family transcriptional regulator